MSHSIVWTKHARARLKERQLTQDRVLKALLRPDKVQPGKRGTKEYIRRHGGQTITAVVQEENDRRVVISAWVDPPFPGTRDAHHARYYRKYQAAGFWGKIWYTILRQIGWW